MSQFVSIPTTLMSSEQLFPYLPHRPPMVWINGILSVSDTGGECLVKLAPNAHYFDHNQRIRKSVCIEWMAQGYGFISAYKDYQKISLAKGMQSDSNVEAYLAAVKNLRFYDFERLNSIDVRYLIVQVNLLRSIPPLHLVEGKILSANKIYATAELKLYAKEG
ncbi:MAG: hypothetical protein HQK52_21625 [Oligoflexia bacterium]|nr:hypothetical protein [Oligoflexia bacterium]